MTRFYEPDLTSNPDDPFVRDASNKLVRRGYWMSLGRVKSLARMARHGKEQHGSPYLIDQICVQEILPPEVPEPDSLGG
jgi:hypothetical protein